MRPWLTPWLPLLAVACSGATPASDAAPHPDAAAEPDAQAGCPSEPAPECDYFLGCGCDTPAEKCGPSADGPACFVAGSGSIGGACATEADCGAGTTCLTYGGTRSCLALCDDTHSCTEDPLKACYIAITDNASPPGVIARACGQVCSALEQDCLLPGQACYLAPSLVPLAELGVCATAGAGTHGQECERSTDCAVGYMCANVEGALTYRCFKFCDRMDGVPACDIGTCQAISGQVRTGVCLTPS